MKKLINYLKLFSGLLYLFLILDTGVFGFWALMELEPLWLKSHLLDM